MQLCVCNTVHILCKFESKCVYKCVYGSVCVWLQMSGFVHMHEFVFRIKGKHKSVCKSIYKRERIAMNKCVCMFMCWLIVEHMYDLLFRGSACVFL